MIPSIASRQALRRLNPSRISLIPAEKDAFLNSCAAGPSSSLRSRSARSAVTKKPVPARRMTSESAWLAEKLVMRFRTPIPTPPPNTTKTVPPVTAVAFIATSRSRVFASCATSRGRDADRPASINRLTPNAARTRATIQNPVAPCQIKSDTSEAITARAEFE